MAAHPTVQRGEGGVPRKRSFARRRAMLFGAVWFVAGLWNVGHAIEHHLHIAHESAIELAVHAGCALATNHEHDHSHPDASPVLSRGKESSEEASTSLVALAEPALPSTRAAWFSTSGPARASLGDAVILGPRAPPIS